MIDGWVDGFGSHIFDSHHPLQSAQSLANGSQDDWQPLGIEMTAHDGRRWPQSGRPCKFHRFCMTNRETPAGKRHAIRV